MIIAINVVRIKTSEYQTEELKQLYLISVDFIKRFFFNWKYNKLAILHPQKELHWRFYITTRTTCTWRYFLKYILNKKSFKIKIRYSYHTQLPIAFVVLFRHKFTFQTCGCEFMSYPQSSLKQFLFTQIYLATDSFLQTVVGISDCK